jgi:hypothetical protein
MSKIQAKPRNERGKLCTYAVTFVNGDQAPWEVHGEVRAGQPHTAVARAARDARSKAKGARWTSVVVLVEKVRDAADRG